MSIRTLVALVISVVFAWTVAARTPPTCSLSLSPSSGPGGTAVVALGTVTPGTSPASTGLAMSLDTSSVGGGLLAMSDNGIAPDAVAGDNIFTAAFVVALATPNGTYTLPALVTDAQARSSNCSATFSVPGGVSSTPIASDGFDYTPAGSALSSYAPPRGSGFTGTWYEQFGNWITQASSLGYTDGTRTLRTSGGRLQTSNAEARRNLYLPGGPLGNTSSTIWVSMLVRQVAGTTANSFGGLTLPTGPGTGLFVGKPYGQSSWGIENAPGPILTTGISTSSTAFLVLRIDFHPGLDDVRLWVNPSLASTPSPGSANIIAPNFGNFENIRILLLHAGASGGGSIIMDADEIRLGYSFPDVAPYALPMNDECAGAFPAFVGPNFFDNSEATTSAPPASCGALGNDTWFQFTPPTTGRYAIDTCGDANFDTVLALYTSCGGSELACNDDSCGLQSRIDFCGTSGVPVYVRVGGFGGDRGYGTFFITAGDPGDPGQTIATAGISTTTTISGMIGDGCGNIDDADVYIIGIDDPTNFAATTVGGATFDTQLFLFDASGIGVTSNDDSPAGGLQSTITGSPMMPPGLYYLAISGYDKDPIDSSSAALWLDTPFNTERTPDGPGAGNPFSTFDTGSTVGGPYSIFLVGVSTPVKPSSCLAGWIGMDDVCPELVQANNLLISDYAKGGKGGILSTTPYASPKGVLHANGGLVDNCVQFGDHSSGTADHTFITFAPNPATNLAVQTGKGGGFTVMAWFNLDSGFSGPMTIVDTFGSGTTGYRIFYASNQLQATVGLGGVNQVLAVSSFTPTAQTWTHVALTLSWGTTGNATANLYARTLGSSNSSSATPRTVAISSRPFTTSLSPRVGADAGNSPGNFFVGLMDEVQIYSCALSSNEVSAIQDAGSAGVAKDKVFAPWETGSQAEANTVDLHGVYIRERRKQVHEPDAPIRLTYAPTPSGGTSAFCNYPAFTSATFTPSETLPAVPRGITPFELHIDAGSTRFIGHACYNVYATNMLTGTTVVGMGSVVDHPRWWGDLDPHNTDNWGEHDQPPTMPPVSTFGFKSVAPISPTSSVDWHFRLTNTTDIGRTIPYMFQALPADMSGSPVPYTLTLASGSTACTPACATAPCDKVCGSVFVPALTTVNLPTVTATLHTPPGTDAIVEVILFADVDGDGSITMHEDLASSGMIAAMMPPLPPPCACHGVCVADFDDGSGTGVPDGGVTIDDLLYFLVQFETGVLCCDVDDGSGTGEPDGGVTIDDLLYFLTQFEAGC